MRIGMHQYPRTGVSRGAVLTGMGTGVLCSASRRGELAQASDVTLAIAWRGSDDARMISGIELNVDGGLSASGVCFPASDPRRFRESYVESVAVHEQQHGSAARKAA